MSEQLVTVAVPLPGRAYQIYIGPGAMQQVGSLLRQRCSATRATMITDSNVGPLYADRAVGALEAAGFDTLAITIPAGDATKSLAQAADLYDRLAERRHGRDEPIIALGGGMVGDLAGFVAATWLRGVPFVQCPTTVEANVDAGVGGKTAVNHPAGKNLIGAFHQPVLACIDTDCLATLSPRDFRAGLAESVKHAVIRDADFFAWHEDHVADILAQDTVVLRELIRRNCENKAAVVVADERETPAEVGVPVARCGTGILPVADQSRVSDDPAGRAGRARLLPSWLAGRLALPSMTGPALPAAVGRAALNFGHTIGHAIEAQLGYELRHGEAVALGMVAAMELAVRHAGFSEAERARVEALLMALELPVRSPRPLDVPDLLRRLGADKKVRNLAVRFVVPPRIGAVRWLEAPPPTDIEDAVRRLVASWEGEPPGEPARQEPRPPREPRP